MKRTILITITILALLSMSQSFAFNAEHGKAGSLIAQKAYADSRSRAGASDLHIDGNDSPGQKPSASDYGKLQMSFEANQGQADGGVKFLSRGSGYTLLLKSTEAVLALRQPAGQKAGNQSATVRMKLSGANPKAVVEGKGLLEGKSNYLIGNDPDKWQTDIPNYSEVNYKGVYPGIDLVYYGNQQQLEYDYVIAPGADYKAIRIGFDGIKRLEIDRDGDLLLQVPGGVIRQPKPYVYQNVNGIKREVASAYTIKGKREVAFQIGEYDRERSLVIDPVLVYSTYLGGVNFDSAADVATDSDGNSYIVGSTRGDFPRSSGKITLPSGGTTDVFVTKLNSLGTALIYSTYFGGPDTRVGSFTAFNTGKSIAIDADGNAYVTGLTTSANFPVTEGAFKTTPSGTQNGFVSKLSPGGNSLVYSSYIGGDNSTDGSDIVLDNSNNAYVVGTTGSTDFTTTGNAYQTSPGGGLDAFLIKVNPTGTSLLYSSYFGGSGNDYGHGISGRTSGAFETYITGGTDSDTDFPVTAGVVQPAFAGVGPFPLEGGDAFVAKFDTAQSGSASLLFSTYLGGSDSETANKIAVDSIGNAYVAGITYSDDFPAAPGAFLTPSGDEEAFAAKITPTGNALTYLTYLGGSGRDSAFAIDVNAAGEAYLTGYTQGLGFPITPDSIQGNYGGGNFDAYIAKFSTLGTALVYSSFLGGGRDEFGNGINVRLAGSANIVGQTTSSNFPVTPSAYQTSLSIGLKGVVEDAFVTRLLDSNLFDTDGDGIPDSVEIDEGTDPFVKDNDVFNNTRLFVMQQYRDFLGREGEPAGITFWVNEINSGIRTRAQVIDAFFNSAEFQAASAPVIRLYFAAFQRVPDLAGLQYWVNQVKLGLPLSEVAQTFAQSPEFIMTYGSLNNSDFVTLLYNNVLMRAPEPAGQAFWTNQLDTMMLTRGQVLLEFSESAEFKMKISNKLFVTQIYIGMLRRVPDPVGFDYWVAFLDGGGSRLNLIDSFLLSAEYHNRFLPPI